MKGLHSRYLQRQCRRNYQQSMEHYTRILKYVVEQSGDGRTYRQGEEQLDFKLRTGVVYGFYCPDNEKYYRTLMVQNNMLTNQTQTHLSNPSYGVIPEGIPQITHQQALRELKPKNLQGLNAFSYDPTKTSSSWVDPKN